MIGALINLIIWLVILGILYAIAIYAVDNLLPEPPRRVVKVVLIVVFGIVAVLLLLQLVGVGSDLNIPRIT
jgi:uncharacterized membrane protein